MGVRAARRRDLQPLLLFDLAVQGGQNDAGAHAAKSLVHELDLVQDFGFSVMVQF